MANASRRSKQRWKFYKSDEKRVDGRNKYTKSAGIIKVELPALEDGRLTKILSKEGEEIEVGKDIAIFETI